MTRLYTYILCINIPIIMNGIYVESATDVTPGCAVICFIIFIRGRSDDDDDARDGHRRPRAIRSTDDDEDDVGSTKDDARVVDVIIVVVIIIIIIIVIHGASGRVVDVVVERSRSRSRS